MGFLDSDFGSHLRMAFVGLLPLCCKALGLIGLYYEYYDFLVPKPTQNMGGPSGSCWDVMKPKRALTKERARPSCILKP